MAHLEIPTSQNPNILQSALRSRTGRTVAALLLPLTVAGCQGLHGNTNTVPSASVVVDVFHGHDIPCMSEVDHSSRLYDCDFSYLYQHPKYDAPSSIPRINLAENNETYGKGKLDCLQYSLITGYFGETCNWADPNLVNLIPSQPEQIVTYNGRDAVCIEEKTIQDRQYTCNLDEPSGFQAPNDLTRISDGTLNAHTMHWNGGILSVLVFNQGGGNVGSTADWGSFRPDTTSSSMPG